MRGSSEMGTVPSMGAGIEERLLHIQGEQSVVLPFRQSVTGLGDSLEYKRDILLIYQQHSTTTNITSQ